MMAQESGKGKNIDPKSFQEEECGKSVMWRGVTRKKFGLAIIAYKTIAEFSEVHTSVK